MLLTRVSTTRRASLFLQSLYLRLSFTQDCHPFSALNEITPAASKAPYLCQHLNTESHLVEAACNNGGHGHVCQTQGHPAPLPLKAVKEGGCHDAQHNACIQSYVKLSASPVRRKKGCSSHGDGKISGLIDANGQSANADVKASEGNATLSTVSRKTGQGGNKEVKVVKGSVKFSCPKGSRKTSVLSYGDVMGSQPEACSKDVDGHFRDGNARVSTCEACRDDDKGHFGHDNLEATACKECGRSAEIHSPTSSVMQGQEELSPSSISPVLSKYDADQGRCALQDTSCSTNGFVTSKRKRNCVPSHASDASSGPQSQSPMLELQEKVELLQAEKMSSDDVARLMKITSFKSASFEHLSAVLHVLKDYFATDERAWQVLANGSRFLLQPVELLQQTLKVLTDFHIKEETVMRLFRNRNDPFGRNVELLQKRLSFFKELGFTVEALNTICCNNHMILRLSVENCILHKLFLERAGFTKGRLVKLLRRRPRILCLSVDDNLITKYKYFQHLGFSAQCISRALEFFAPFPMEKVQARMQFIKDLGFSDEDVQHLISLQPSILGMRSEGVKARFDFLVNEQNRDIAEIVKCPSCLVFSLHGRIIPRFKILGTLGCSKMYSLSTILSCTARKFKSMFPA